MDEGLIVRRPGWEGRLSAHVVAHLTVQFRWGRTDCAMFAAGAVEALSGVDLARGFRGYRSEAEGLRAVQAKGFDDYEAVFAARLRAALIEMLAPGDIAVVVQNDRAVMGVFASDGVRGMTVGGLGLLPADAIVRGYAV